MSHSLPTVSVGSLVRWKDSGDQLWIVLMVQIGNILIRTLPFSDGSFATRNRPSEELTIIQTGNIMIKDPAGEASKYAYVNREE